jgi:hypothetical protein
VLLDKEETVLQGIIGRVIELQDPVEWKWMWKKLK